MKISRKLFTSEERLCGAEHKRSFCGAPRYAESWGWRRIDHGPSSSRFQRVGGHAKISSMRITAAISGSGSSRFAFLALAFARSATFR